MLQSSALGHHKRKYNQKQVIDSLAAAFVKASAVTAASAA
jgi:hypothetical protein